MTYQNIFHLKDDEKHVIHIRQDKKKVKLECHAKR